MRVMESIARRMARTILDLATRLAPCECSDWARAMRAEGEQTMNGWEHLSWAAGSAASLVLKSLSAPRVRRHVLRASAVAYFVALLVLVAITAAVFRDLYAPVAGSPFPGWGDVLQRDQAVALSGTYRSFVEVPWHLLAAFAGLWGGAVGVLSGSFWRGVMALGGAVAAAALAFVLLPPVYFPFDQYAAPAAWVFLSLPTAGAVWLLVTLLGLVARKARIA